MEETLHFLLKEILVGGPAAIVAILSIIIYALYKETKSLKSEIKTKDERIYKIIQDYYDGTRTLTNAIDGIKTVLGEIKSRF